MNCGRHLIRRHIAYAKAVVPPCRRLPVPERREWVQQRTTAVRANGSGESVRGVLLDGVRRRNVWNSSVLDEEQARELEDRIRVQVLSLERIEEEMSATSTTTQPEEMERLKRQRRQRASKLQELLSQYKKVAGEDYHVDEEHVKPR